MKTITLLGALVLAAAPQAAGQTLALFTFDDGTPRDLSGNGKDAALLLSPVFTPGGYEGGGVEFSGSNGLRVEVDINPSVRPKLTMGCWVRPRAVASVRHVLSHDNGGYDRDIAVDTRGGGLGWSAFRGSGVLGFIPARAEEWQFVAAVWDAEAGTTMLYVDGEVRSSAGRPGAGYPYLVIGKSSCCDLGLAAVLDGVFVLGEALPVSRLDEIWAGGVRKAPTCPLILDPPQTRVACVNELAALDADVAGSGDLTVVWQKEVPHGSDIWVDVVDGVTAEGSEISGAGTPHLRIDRCKAGDVGLYRVVARNGCDPAGVASRPAGLFICPPDVNCDGFMDFFDYADFVEAFERGEPRADYNDDQFIDFFDYLDFVEDFERGC